MECVLISLTFYSSDSDAHEFTCVHSISSSTYSFTSDDGLGILTFTSFLSLRDYLLSLIS